MKIVYLGPLWIGSTALQRCEAMQRVPGVELVRVDSNEPWGRSKTPIMDSIRHRLRLPRDRGQINARLPGEILHHRPEVVFIDSVRVLTRKTLQVVLQTGRPKIVFYTPDDIIASHNSSRQLERSYAVWDLFFTTKTFNVSELRERGVKRPQLIGKAFDPSIHRQFNREEVGPDYESYDIALAATWEAERMHSVNRLAAAGLKVVVVGNGWNRQSLDPRVEWRAPVFEKEYAKTLHFGKLCLCPLRKINRDRVTQRSVEIPACGRLMLAEKTDEHDAMFKDGLEYVSYQNDDELVNIAKSLLVEDERRRRIAEAGHRRCLTSGYSVDDRACEMVDGIRSIL